MSKTKKREQIISECIGAMTACYNYYSDDRLSDEIRIRVVEVFREMLPSIIKTSFWEGYAAEYDARAATEGELKINPWLAGN